MTVDSILELILTYRNEKQEAASDLSDIDVELVNMTKAEAANDIYLRIIHFLQGGE